MNKSALIVPTKVETAVQPKPTKAEIIEAMTQLKLKKLQEESLALETKREALRTKVKTELEKYVAKSIKSLPMSVNLGGFWGGKVQHVSADIKVRFDDLPEPLKKKLEEYHTMPGRIGIPEAHHVRKSIRDSLANNTPKTQRVEALLSSPECVEALEKMLKELNKA